MHVYVSWGWSAFKLSGKELHQSLMILNHGVLLGGRWVYEQRRVPETSAHHPHLVRLRRTCPLKAEHAEYGCFSHIRFAHPLLRLQIVDMDGGPDGQT
eukprot:52609-Chlamydomonas_euryale.AAC.1